MLLFNRTKKFGNPGWILKLKNAQGIEKSRNSSDSLLEYYNYWFVILNYWLKGTMLVGKWKVLIEHSWNSESQEYQTSII